MKVIVCRLPGQVKEENLHPFLPYIGQERRKRIERFYYINDAFRSLIGDLLVIHMSDGFPGTTEKKRSIQRNRYGKPYFPDLPNLQFNVSHSGEWVACTIHESKVGIDIEEHKDMDFRLGEQLFPEEEWERIHESEHSLQAFYDLWTRKESYVKAVGKGLNIPLDSFCLDNGKPVSVETKQVEDEFDCFSVPFAEGYSLAVCVKNDSGSEKDIHVQETTFDALVQSIRKREEVPICSYK